MTDDQLEDLLTRHGRDWRAAQPAAPSLAAMAGAPHPGRTPWLLPALVAAALLVPVVGTVVLLGRHDPAPPAVPVVNRGGTAPVVVPWADLPAPAPDPAPVTPRASTDQALPAGTALCGAGDFTGPAATPTSLPGPLGNGRYLLTVQRIGTEPCAIGNDTPTVQLIDSAGHGNPRGFGDPLLIGYPGATILQPGDVIQVPARICGSDIASVQLRLPSAPDDPSMIGRLPGVAVPIPFPLPSSCPSGGSGTSHQRVLSGGSLAALVPTFAVPSRLAAGRPLDYSVTLTNPGDWLDSGATDARGYGQFPTVTVY